MGMEKMTYVNIYGGDSNPEPTLELLTRLGCFHPDTAASESVNAVKEQENIYEPLFSKINGLIEDLGKKPNFQDYQGRPFEYENSNEYVEGFCLQVSERNAKKAEIINNKTIAEQAKIQLNHFKDVSTSIDDIFSLKYLKVRFGRMPKDSFAKLEYYQDKPFNFTEYDFDGENYWGIYFTPAQFAPEADHVFESLYFERIWVPEFIHGTPVEAIELLTARIQEMDEQIKSLGDFSDIATKEDLEKLTFMGEWAKYRAELFDMRKFAVVLDNSFMISGFVPDKDFNRLKEKLEALKKYKISVDKRTDEPPTTPPVKLKNNWYSRPFEMFVNMYGLPSYGDIDPTVFVSLTYSLLFGIMFGDVGQGVLLGIIGYFIMYKKLKMQLGVIITRCSVFSVFFGFIYGSVFGFEEALDPLYHALGMSGKPLHVMSNEATNLILIASIAFGICIIAIALIMGIVSKVKRKQVADAIFSVNGLAGLVFYISVILLVVKMAFGLNIPFVASVPFDILFLGVPFIFMYFSEPFIHIAQKKKIHEKPSEILVNGFFEIFDAALSFASNTMSFLRVGGFVLAHAGMMSVVFTLANMSSGFAYVLIIIIGNIFVMGIEALFVGIQVLRLEFYEAFSRFLDADGKPFTPLKISKN